MKRTLALATALAFAVAACGDDGPTGPGGGGNDMEATVGGAAFNPPSLSVQGTFTTTQNVFVLAGVQTASGTTTSINIAVVGAEEGATIQFTPTSGGTLALVSTTVGQTVSVWTTGLSPATGSITFTELDTEGAKGTFQFTGQAQPGTPATGQKTVTSGTFDVEF